MHARPALFDPASPARQRRCGAPRRTMPVWVDLPAFTAFSQDVEDALDAGELRYSRRDRLLSRARRLGIRRFDANLIIAMVQHRTEGMGAKSGLSGATAKPASWIESRAATLLAVVAVQAVIVLAAWWILV